MAFAIDYSWARPNPVAIRAAGYTGVLRYVSRPASNGKNITKPELDALRAAGLDVTLNFEQYERRPLEGYIAGGDDARSADALADTVGYPRACAIYYSVDFGTSWAAIREYFRGVQAGSRRPVGIYAGLPLCHAALDAGYASFAWVTNAASWSGLSTWSALKTAVAASGRCHLLQHVHSNTPIHIPGVDDVQFDPNTILAANYGQWGDNVEEDDMTQTEHDQLQALFDLFFQGKGGLRAATGKTDVSMIHDLENIDLDVQKRVKALATAVAAGTAAPAPVPAAVDLEALATAVADKLAARLKA